MGLIQAPIWGFLGKLFSKWDKSLLVGLGGWSWGGVGLCIELLHCHRVKFSSSLWIIQSLIFFPNRRKILNWKTISGPGCQVQLKVEPMPTETFHSSSKKWKSTFKSCRWTVLLKSWDVGFLEYHTYTSEYDYQPLLHDQLASMIKLDGKYSKPSGVTASPKCAQCVQ